MTRWIRNLAVITVTLMLAGGGMARAEYPEGNITAMVGYKAGGGTDVMVRTIAPFLEKELGATVVVENVPGAGSQIAWTKLTQAKPDGYTISNMNLPSMVSKLYDRTPDFNVDSFTYLANVVDDPNVIVTKKGSKFKYLKEVIEAAKANPGAITYGIPSLGSDDHFLVVQLMDKAEIELTVIPFRGGSAPARAAIMGGHVSMGGLNLSEALSYPDEFDILAVSARERSELAPEIPTVSELGYDVFMSSMRGFVGPANLPEDVTGKLLKAFENTFANPEFKAIAEKQGMPVRPLLGEEYRAVANEQNQTARTVWEKTPWVKK